jgi:hypothetical protein
MRRVRLPRPVVCAVAIVAALLVPTLARADAIQGRWERQVGNYISYYEFHAPYEQGPSWSRGRFEHAEVGPFGVVVHHGTYILNHHSSQAGGHLELRFDNGRREDDREWRPGRNVLVLRHRGQLMEYFRR